MYFLCSTDMEATAEEDMEDTTDEAATIKAIIIRSIGWIKGQIRFLYHVEMKSTRLQKIHQSLQR